MRTSTRWSPCSSVGRWPVKPIAPRMLFAALADHPAVVIIVTRSKEVPSET